MHKPSNSSLFKIHKLIVHEILQWEEARYRHDKHAERVLVLAALMILTSLGIITNYELYTQKIMLGAALASFTASLLGCIIYKKPPVPPIRLSWEPRTIDHTTAPRWIAALNPLLETLQQPETLVIEENNGRETRLKIQLAPCNTGSKRHIQMKNQIAEHLLVHLAQPPAAILHTNKTSPIPFKNNPTNRMSEKLNPEPTSPDLRVFVDTPFRMESRDAQAHRAGARHDHQWSHLWCNPGGEDALHALAYQIGMRRNWFQNKPGFPHYDLVPSKRAAAVRGGALEIELKDWIHKRQTKTRAAAEALADPASNLVSQTNHV